MKQVIISFSQTMNNEKVAEGLAKDLHIDWIRIEEQRKRHIMTNVLDVLFARKPKITLDLKVLENYEFLIFIGPVWLGHPASPFRRIFDYIKSHPKKYGLITVCGGNNECFSNPSLQKYLLKRTAIEPVFIKELKVYDLLPQMAEKERNELMLKYHINPEEVQTFVEASKSVIQEYL